MTRLLIGAFLIISVACHAPAQAPRPAAPVNANRVTFVLAYKLTPASTTTQFKFDVLVPKSIAGRQKVLATKYSLEPARKFEKDGNAYAEFVFDELKSIVEFTITVDAEVYRYDFSVAAGSKKNRQLDKPQALKKWLAEEPYLEKNAPEITAIAKDLQGKTPEETVRKTLAFVIGTLKQGPFDSADHGAVWALKEKRGDCTEFTDLFVTLCRANGVPARFREGFLIHDVPKNDTPKHNWAEVYLPDLGWVPFDPFHVHLRAATEDRLKPIYIYLDQHRRNEVLNNYHFFAYWYRGDKVKVDGEFQLKSRKPIDGKPSD